jgi:hypothetical protein
MPLSRSCGLKTDAKKIPSNEDCGPELFQEKIGHYPR